MASEANSPPELYCRFCETPIATDKVMPQASLVKCQRCERYSFLPPSWNSAGKHMTKLWTEVEKPTSLLVEEFSDHLRITREQDWKKVFEGLRKFGFAALCGVMMAIILPSSSVPVPVHLLCPIIFLGFCFLLLLLVAALDLLEGLFNRLVIEVDHHAIQLKNGPIRTPTSQSRTVLSQEIQQLTSNDRQVIATLLGGRHVVLVDGLPNKDYALYLEQEIEHYLGIRNYPINIVRPNQIESLPQDRKPKRKTR
jgi:hypothetical protein